MSNPIFTFDEAERTLWVDVTPEQYWNLWDWRRPGYQVPEGTQLIAEQIAERLTAIRREQRNPEILVKLRTIHMGALAAVENASSA